MRDIEQATDDSLWMGEDNRSDGLYHLTPRQGGQCLSTGCDKVVERIPTRVGGTRHIAVGRRTGKVVDIGLIGE